jgi:hypothetical protein
MYKNLTRILKNLIQIENLNFISGPKILEGYPRPALTALAYSTSRFCILKFTKPVDERDLQVPATAARAINAA